MEEKIEFVQNGVDTKRNLVFFEGLKTKKVHSLSIRVLNYFI